MQSKRNDKNRKTEELITKDYMVINSGKGMCSCIDAVDMRYVVASQDDDRSHPSCTGQHIAGDSVRKYVDMEVCDKRMKRLKKDRCNL